MAGNMSLGWISPEPGASGLALLGRCVIRRADAAEILPQLNDSDFPHPPHLMLFHVLRDAMASDLPWLPAVFSEHMLGNVAAVLDALQGALPLEIEWPEYLRSLKRHSRLRLSREILEKALTASPTPSPEQVLARLEALEPELVPEAETWHQVAARVAQRRERPRVPLPWPQLDRHLQLVGGRFLVIAARPRVGKTAMLVDIAVHAAEAGWPTLLHSMEMAPEDVVERHHRPHLQGVLELFTPRSGKIAEIRAASKHFRARFPQALILFDYLQLARPRLSSLPRWEQVGEISRDLKAMALGLDVPLIVAAQLSRAVEQRGEDARPKLSDLRESGDIEQTADAILLLHRKPPGTATEANLDKNRYGQQGLIPLLFLTEQVRFVSAPEERPWHHSGSATADS